VDQGLEIDLAADLALFRAALSKHCPEQLYPKHSSMAHQKESGH